MPELNARLKKLLAPTPRAEFGRLGAATNNEPPTSDTSPLIAAVADEARQARAGTMVAAVIVLTAAVVLFLHPFPGRADAAALAVLAGALFFGLRNAGRWAAARRLQIILAGLEPATAVTILRILLNPPRE